ncbi:MAG TPA: biotin carboxylase N-terminal domain-containing protein [Pseudonocardia sp.]|uniref:acetyl/propionyl/methylcrotonyl-CoA carboxylase subunit alpha n=1 Tax=Pseudonocardia sp. TaxID=60912 RepID=UPI002C567375|nr:biotin carboxylase N-terminal domain-containing protein [Pseudonocardia sp.]HTF52705.1 biotin carboxylase N-terminal domain-containing protein [Pseudonocardia sp.]
MFDTVLIANRGEIAVRVIRTLRALGVRSVAVFSDADAGARHVAEADVAVHIGPTPANQSYLNIRAVVDAAVRTRARAVHPGYGFLSENAAFARACADAGLVFIGPPVAAIEAMGDKIRAKATVAAAGVPVVPGGGAPGLSDERLAEIAREIGFPVLLKPSAGGGGKGMRLVTEDGQLHDAIAGARREARGSFGDDTLLVERFITDPRHIEIQVLADQHGTVLHLGERECSLQRRHQKIIEEAPSPLLTGAQRAAMGAAAVEAARAVGYTGAGTVEFIVNGSDADEHFFMEMNTRLQVEHPVTEMITGLDLVELQLRVAAGEPLGLRQQDIRLAGHAVEARIYAEDPARGFLPTGGRVLTLHEPSGPGIRVDSGLRPNLEISGAYDPMLAKVIAHGPDRETALRRLDGALVDTAVLGVPTNVAFLRALLRHPDVVAGRLDTGLVERALDELVDGTIPDPVYVVAALQRVLELEPAGPVTNPWDIPGGWRLGEPAWSTWRFELSGHDPVDVRVRGRASAAEVSVGGGEPTACALRHDDGADGAELVLSYSGATQRYTTAGTNGRRWLGRRGRSWVLAETGRLAAARSDTSGAAGGTLRSPMPGTVLAVAVADGDLVHAGQPLLVIEAMKMEHTIAAPTDGVIAELAVREGSQVAVDAPLVTVVPPSTTEASGASQ